MSPARIESNLYIAGLISQTCKQRDQIRHRISISVEQKWSNQIHSFRLKKIDVNI